jgi:hypothetical protein
VKANASVNTRTTSFWARVAQVVAVVVPIASTLERFRRPFGEKFMFPNLGGSSDLWLPYLGARAIVAHLDPYGPLPQYLHEPSGWPTTYPPTMLALYVPLVWATGEDIELACQVFYWLNLVALAALSLIVWRLSLRLAPRSEKASSSLLVIVIALSLNGLTMFAVDRSQSEIVSAALCWGGVLLFLRGQHGFAMVAVTTAGAIKGYAVPVGIGLLLATRGRKQILHALAGAAAVGLALTVPVHQYLIHGFQSMLFRVEFSWVSIWFNHSFKNAFFQFEPKLGDPGRRWMTVIGIAVMIGSGWRLFIASRRGTHWEVTARAIIFAGAALALMIGVPVYSGPYNYLLVLPALILASCHYREFCDVLRLEGILSNVLAVVLIAALALALRVKVVDRDWSLPAVALVLFVGCLGLLTIARPRHSF